MMCLFATERDEGEEFLRDLFSPFQVSQFDHDDAFDDVTLELFDEVACGDHRSCNRRQSYVNAGRNSQNA